MEIEQVENFPYLGSIVFTDGGSEDNTNVKPVLFPESETLREEAGLANKIPSMVIDHLGSSLTEDASLCSRKRGRP